MPAAAILAVAMMADLASQDNRLSAGRAVRPDRAPDDTGTSVLWRTRDVHTPAPTPDLS